MACTNDTESIDLEVVAGILTADLIVDPAPAVAGVAAVPNPLLTRSAGVFVAGADGWLTLPVTLAYSAADSPTFVATTSSDLRSFITPGDKIRLDQSGTKYFFVTAITASTITLYGGTDYTLANAAISSVYFSKDRSPVGFPLDPNKWEVVATDTTQRIQTNPAQNTWYNPGSVGITLPIGVWDVEYFVTVYFNSSGTSSSGYVTFSTANNSETDKAMTCGFTSGTAGNAGIHPATRRKDIPITVKTSYFLDIRTTDAITGSLGYLNDVSTAVLRAKIAYL